MTEAWTPADLDDAAWAYLILLFTDHLGEVLEAGCPDPEGFRRCGEAFAQFQRYAVSPRDIERERSLDEAAVLRLVVQLVLRPPGMDHAALLGIGCARLRGWLRLASILSRDGDGLDDDEWRLAWGLKTELEGLVSADGPASLSGVLP